jgi:outer membrane autotransporter protein
MHHGRAARWRGSARLGATLLVPALAVASSLAARAGDDFTQFAMTPDQTSVAKALDRGTGDASFDALRLDLASLPPLKIGDGLTQLGSEIAVVTPNVTQADRRAFLASLIDRLGPSCLEKGARYDADPVALKPSVWGRGFYRTDDISAGGGGTVGLEVHPDRHVCAGLGFNYANTNLALDGLPQSSDVQSYSLGAYMRGDSKHFFADGAVAATFATIDTTRQIPFAEMTAKGDDRSTGAGLVAGIGAVLHAGIYTFEPRIGLDYDHNDQNGFTETGAGAADLRIGGEDRDALRSNLGTRAHAIFDLGGGASVMPELSVAWAHNLIDPAVSIEEQFVAAKNASFRIEGNAPPKDFFLFGAGLSFHPNASDEIIIRYNRALAKDVEADVFIAGGKISW